MTILLLALIGFLLLAMVTLNALNTNLMQGREARVMAIVKAGLHLVQH